LAQGISHLVYADVSWSSALLGPAITVHHLLVGPNYGAVNHDVSVIRAIRQRPESPLPDYGADSYGEPLLRVFPVVIPGGRVHSLSAAAPHSEHADNEIPVVPGPCSHRTGPSWREPLYPVPPSGA